MTRSLFTLLSCFNFVFLFAQPDIISVTTTESTCENNGTLSVSAINVAGTGSLSYYLMSGPAGPIYPIYIEDPNTTFYSLYPGTYDIRVADTDGGSSTATAIVPGNYLQPDLILTGTDPNCPESFDGTITATMSLGNDPYEYEITAGPVTAARSSNNIFLGLSAGIYTVVAYDSCDNFQTRMWTLTDPVLTPISASMGYYIDRINCDSAQFSIGKNGGKSPYTYEVISPITTAPQAGSQITLPKDPEYTFNVTDACGNSATVKGKYTDRMSPFTHSKTCTTFSLSVRNFTTFGQDLTYELYASDNSTLLDGPQANDNTFADIPFGFYYVHVTNECGDTKILNRGAGPAQAVNFTNYNASFNTCNINTGYARVNVSSNVSLPVTYTLIDYPSGVTPPTPITVNSTSTSFSDLPLGAYQAMAEDACGNLDTLDFSIIEVHEITFEAEAILGCGLSDNTIEATATSNDPNTTFIYKLLYESNGYQIALNNDGTFNNLDSGTYIVLIDLCGNRDFRDTLHVKGYRQPDIDPVIGMIADNGTVTISAVGIYGQPPYLFDIPQGPELRPYQSEPLFENLPIGNNYRVRVLDACGNTFNRDVSVDTFFTVNIERRGQVCVGEPVKLLADTVGGGRYDWVGPNGFTSNQRTPLFPNLTQADSGKYSLTVSLGNNARSTFEKNLNVRSSCTLPVEMAYFKVHYQEKDNSVQLKWRTTSELNSAFFEIQRSSNGKDWKMIDVVEAIGSEDVVSDYQAIDQRPLGGSNYYRLLQVDYDGETSFSEIASIFRDMTKTITVAPNPVTNGQVQIIMKQGADSGQFSIFDHMGRKVITQSFREEPFINVDIGPLPPGLYYAHVLFTDDTGHTRKFIKKE